MSDKYCILQDDLKDCGVCCLLSVIKYYNGDISKEYLRELTKTTKEGVTALNLLKCARELGFEAYGIKGKLNSIKKEYLPIIAHVIIDKKYPHFVVIYKIDFKKNRILVMDPAKGYSYYLFSNFISISTNYFLVLKAKHVIPKLVEKNNYIERLLSFILKYKDILITIIIMSLFYTISNIICSFQFKILYEKNIEKDFNFLFLFLLLIVVFKCLIDLFRNKIINNFNIIFDKYLTKDAFYHIINLPYLYYRNHTNGDLLTRINDISNVKNLISNFFVSIFVDLILAVIVGYVMFKISSSLSLLLIIHLLLYSIIVIINSKRIKKMIRNHYESSAEVYNFMVESFASFETIKNQSLQNYMYRKFEEKYLMHSEILKKLFNKLNNESFFKNALLLIGNLLVIYYGIRNIQNNNLSIITLITYLSLSNYLIEPIKRLLDLHFEYQNVKESIRRIKELYHIPTELMISNKKSIKFLIGKIEIQNLTYSYNGVDNVFENISININEGDKVLIYGNSGCGKSTIMQLLIKYLDCNYKGYITIGGFDLKDIDIFSLRKNICYISQNEYLYTDTLYENITLGRNINYQVFLKVANGLSINEIVHKTSLGYNLLIEGNGENLSGGERKRIIIARSLFSKANILIYDESFSEIDIDKERKILKYIFEKNAKKTIIVISHRFSNEDLFNLKIKIGGDVNE